MNTVLNLFGHLRNGFGCISKLLGYLLRFVSMFFCTRASLAARLVAAESRGAKTTGVRWLCRSCA